jgi:hypothetical protein
LFVFMALTLTPLGKATASGSGEEGDFVATFTIPGNATPGSYTVRAATDQGEGAVADLTVTAPSREASAKPAELREPTGETHLVDRSKPTGQVIGAIVAAIVSGGLGLWLVRQRG